MSNNLNKRQRDSQELSLEDEGSEKQNRRSNFQKKKNKKFNNSKNRNVYSPERNEGNYSSRRKRK